MVLEWTGGVETMTDGICTIGMQFSIPLLLNRPLFRLRIKMENRPSSNDIHILNFQGKFVAQMILGSGFGPESQVMG